VAVLSRTALEAPESYEGWLAIYLRLVATLPEPRLPACPNCGRFEVRYRFVAEAETRIGYCALWCANCHHGAMMSRVRVPEAAEFLDSGLNVDAIRAEIPAFEIATPAPDAPGAPVTPDRSLLLRRLEELEPYAAEYRRLAGLLEAEPEAFDLTPREREVLALIAQGKSHHAVAAELGLAESMVEHHLQSVLSKLGGAMRAGAKSDEAPHPPN
jgi:DNA-binding CsgD family transcriptional regulator